MTIAFTFHFPTRSLLAMALALFMSGVGAQTAPSTVKLIVGYVAGGPVDAAARVFAPALSRELGQTVVVENRAGAGGALAGQSVVKSPPNGSEIFFAASPTMTITPHVLKAMTFDPLKDMTPLAPILSYANVLVINLNQPFKTLPELLAYAKANPGQLAYGSAGMGASNHLSGELFASRAGVSMTHIPYKGNAPAMTKALQDPDLRKRWIDQGYVIWSGNGGELAERMRREHALWAEVTKGMKFD